MSLFAYTNPFPGVYHITDPLNVCITLLVGTERALLLDTGYGVADPRPTLAALTDKPLTVLCSHGHFDHALGCRYFETVLMPDAPEIPLLYTSVCQRQRALARARELGVPADDEAGYLSIDPMAHFAPLNVERFELGGLTAEIVPMPGHTPGSIGLWVPQRELLLPGDNQNPTTWVFFPECVPLPQYVATMNRVAALPFRWVLTPHCEAVESGEALRSFIAGLTDATFDAAVPIHIDPYSQILRTMECAPTPETRLVFDAAKRR